MRDIFGGAHKLVKKMVNILNPLLVGELNCSVNYFRPLQQMLNDLVVNTSPGLRVRFSLFFAPFY